MARFGQPGSGFISNKPIRRVAHAGRSLGGYSALADRMQLGNYPQDCSNCMSSATLTAFLASNSVANQAVQNLMQTGYWPSGNPGPNGWSIQDPTYGLVTLIIDGNGNLYALQNSTAPAVQPSVINAPPVVSPTTPAGTTSCTDSLEDFAACAAGYGQTLLWIGGLYLLYKVFK